MPSIYVTGHRNPDTDSIASAVGYAELKARLDPRNDYIGVRLGDCNAQTRWVIERSQAPEPPFLPHVMLRVCDVMQTSFPIAQEDEPIRIAGMAMAHADLELVPVVDEGGALQGVVTERMLARRYVRESRQTSTLKDAPTAIDAIVDVLEGELIVGESAGRDGEPLLLEGRVWVQSMDPASPTGVSDGDVVVVGNRPDAQRLAIESGAALLVISNGSSPEDEIRELAQRHGTAVI